MKYIILSLALSGCSGVIPYVSDEKEPSISESPIHRENPGRLVPGNVTTRILEARNPTTKPIVMLIDCPEELYTFYVPALSMKRGFILGETAFAQVCHLVFWENSKPPKAM